MLDKNESINRIFTEVLSGNISNKVPIWFMRQAGRYLPEYKEVRNKTNSFLEFCYNPKLASKVTLQPIDRFNFDAAIIFSDILVIPDALGVKVSFVKNKGPVLEGGDESLSNLEFDLGKLSPVYEAIRLTRSRLDGGKSLIGFAGSPWTLATYMIEGGSSRDFLKTKELSYEDEEYFSGLVDILASSVSKHLIKQVEAGVDVLQLFDSWAGVLTEGQFRRWVIEPTRKIVSEVKSIFPDIPIIGFPKGSGVLYKDYALEAGVDAISFDQNMPCEWIRDNIDIVVQGNLDPVLLAADKEAAVKQAKSILQIFKDRPFIFNLGHGILPHTPIENVEAVVKVVKEYA